MTLATMRLTPSDIAAIERAHCADLAGFAQRAWRILEPSTPLKWGWALDATCAHLEAVTRGETKRLLINVPPGMMKSLLTGVIWPAWEWGPCNRPGLRYIGTAHAQHLAVRDSMKCRRLIQSEWYQRHWPIALTSDQNAKTKFENAKTGFREGMAFTSMTGARGDRVILDDPISADSANSDADLLSAERTFTETLPTRVNNSDSAIVVIMQRLSERDTSGIILSRDLGYTHLCLPMRFEPDRADPMDRRTIPSELLFPERFDAEQVDQLEHTLGSYATAGQLQQRPAPRGGGIFKDAWWQFYDQPPRMEWRAIYADTAQKTGKENDYSVFQLWGRSHSGQAVMLDMIRGKWEAPELLTHARAFWRKHKEGSSHLRAMKVEDKVSGTGLIQTLKREGVPVLPIKRDRDKVTRGHDAAPMIESGNVLLPRRAEWLSGFLTEAAVFPFGAHDDQMDPMMDAVADMAGTATPNIRAL